MGDGDPNPGILGKVEFINRGTTAVMLKCSQQVLEYLQEYGPDFIASFVPTRYLGSVGGNGTDKE